MNIVLKDISKLYEQTCLYQNVNLTIKQGEFVVINGVSGSGKSTLGNIIGNIELPSSGKVIYEPKTENLYRNDISFIFQNYGLIETETIYENLKIAFIGKKVPKQDQKRKCIQVLDSVGLEKDLNTKITALSGGEKQRVAIARVFLKKPNIVIADEPTGNLDDQNTQLINTLLIDLNQKGTTVILITHKEFHTKGARHITIVNNDIIEKKEQI